MTAAAPVRVVHYVNQFFAGLGGDADRVVLMTYSEFGRRVRENGSHGTDHGAGSCLFVAGPGVRGGAVNPHPRLDELDGGDLKFAIDFRRVYATLLDHWMAWTPRRCSAASTSRSASSSRAGDRRLS